MTRPAKSAALCLLAISLSVSACGTGEAAQPPDERLANVFETVTAEPVGATLAKSATPFVINVIRGANDLVVNRPGDVPEPWSDEKITAEMADAAQAYEQRFGETLMSAAMDNVDLADLAAVETALDDDAQRAALACAFQNGTGEGLAYADCTAQGNVELSAELQRQFTALSDAYGNAFVSPAPSVLFGVAICDTLDRYADEFTYGPHSFNFDGITFGLNDDSRNCPEYRIALAALDARASEPGIETQ